MRLSKESEVLTLSKIKSSFQYTLDWHGFRRPRMFTVAEYNRLVARHKRVIRLIDRIQVLLCYPDPAVRPFKRVSDRQKIACLAGLKASLQVSLRYQYAVGSSSSVLTKRQYNAFVKRNELVVRLVSQLQKELRYDRL